MRTQILLAAMMLTCAGAAQADDVLFTGEVLPGCTILAHTDGALGMDLTSNGTILTSDLPYGHAGSVTVLATSASYVNVGPPSLQASGAGYTPAGQTLAVKYLGVGVLSVVNQGWTTVGTSKLATSILGAAVAIDNRITNTAGFPQGTYTTKTVVSCTPTAQY